MPRSRRTDPETYGLYLQAKYIVDILQHRVDEAEALLQQALDRDPDYLPALILIAKATYFIAGDSEGNEYTHEQGATLIRGYVDRALAIDPTNSAALAHRSWMAFLYQNDLETAADYINRALEYDPANEWALFVATVLSLKIGRNDDAIAMAEAGLTRDPLCSGCLYNLMKAAIRSGRYEEALAASERRMRVAAGGWITRGDIYLLKGDARKALELYDRQKEGRADWLRSRVLAFHALQEFDKRDDALSQLLETQDSGACDAIAQAQAWLGNVDEAFACLERYLDPRHPAFVDRATSVVWDRFLQNLHDDPRWSELRDKAGLDEERLSKIRIEMP
jgi:tetratricopeptide (TPR) repeat protein